MKIFCAIDDAGIVKSFYEKTGIKMNYLVSYYYAKGVTHKLAYKYRHMIDSLYLDSGAYTAMTMGKKISLAEYGLYLKECGEFFDAYFNLDDQFDKPQSNTSNQLYLEKLLPDGTKKPIPVVHAKGEAAFNELSEYANMGHQFIAIGSEPRLPDDIHSKIQDTFPDVKLHMFGNLERKMLINHMPYSADSASWAEVASHGEILYWNEEEKKEYCLHLGGKDMKSTTPDYYKDFTYKDKANEFLKETFDYHYTDLLATGSSLKRQIVNVYFFKQLQDYLNSLQKPSPSSIETPPEK
jgi:hypothetical protein